MKCAEKKALQEYNAYFAEHRASIDMHHLHRQLTKAGIQLIRIRQLRPYSIGTSQRTIRVRPLKVQARGALITYIVQIGPLVLKVLLLNIPEKATLTNRDLIQTNCKRTCSVYLSKTVCNGEIICKRFEFFEAQDLRRPTEKEKPLLPLNAYDTVESAIVEYSIGKVCAALEIGIGVGTPDHKFDLLCYEDCVEFFMQKGQLLNGMRLDQSDIFRIEQRLKQCLCIMHSFGLIHKDVKPRNILLNLSDLEVVLADFGISTYVRQKPGEKSLTYRQGTAFFMCPQMNFLSDSRLGRVDLFYNDMWALQCTINALSQKLQKNVIHQDKRKRKQAQLCSLDIQIRDLSLVVFQNQHLKVGSSTMAFEPFFNSMNPCVLETNLDINFIARSIDPKRILSGYIGKVQVSAQHRHKIAKRSLESEGRGYSIFGGVRQVGSLEDQRRYYLKRMSLLSAEGTEKQQLAFNTCELALSLVFQMQMLGLSEQPAVILREIHPYVTHTQKDQYRSANLTNLLIAGSVNLVTVNRSLQQITDRSCNILFGVYSCFTRSDYSLALSLLNCLFPKSKLLAQQPTQKSVLQFIKAVYHKLQAGLFTGMLYTVFDLLLKCAIHAKCYEIILNLEQPTEFPELVCLYYLAKRRVYKVTGDNQKALSENRQAYRISCELATDWSIESINTYLGICHIECSMGNMENILPQTMSILEYLTGVYVYLNALRRIAQYTRFRPELCQLLIEVEKCDVLWKQLEACEQFHRLVSMSILYQFVGVNDKADKLQFEALKLVDKVSWSNQKMQVLAIFLNDLSSSFSKSNSSKAQRLLLLLNRILECSSYSFKTQSLISMISSFLAMKHLGRDDLFRKWMSLTFEYLQRSKTEGLQYLLEDNGLTLLQANCYEEAYSIARFGIRENGVCTYIAGACLFHIQENWAESQKLIRAFLAHNTVLGGSESTKRQIASSYLILATIQEQKNPHESKSYRDTAFQVFATLNHHFHWSLSGLPYLLGISSRYGYTRLELLTSCRLQKILFDRNSSLLKRQKFTILSALVGSAFRRNRFEKVASYFNRCESYQRRLFGMEELKCWARSYLFLRKLKGFYQAIQLLLRGCQRVFAVRIERRKV